jgi:tRNA modification GTPase
MKPDTIAALATGAGRAGVAVIRLSGPDAGATLSALTARDLPKPRMATREAFCDPRTGVSLDDGLALWFPGPHSFTGEDVVELHIHGGPAVIAAVIDAALSQPGVRPAEPGEYTRRAFENGKLDLAEAEGLADLVDAETEGQRRQALRQRRGALSAVYEGWRARLIEGAALIEAEIDFPDEDLPAALAQRAGPILQALADDMGQHLNDAHRGERIRDGFRIAIIGPPNAGKSSLLNALAQREAAIVSDIPGTTRDIVEVRLVLAGFPVWIADTAGLREAADAIEAEGVRRALARAEEADLRIGVVEAGSDPRSVQALSPWTRLICWCAIQARSHGPPASRRPAPASAERDAGGPYQRHDRRRSARA